MATTDLAQCSKCAALLNDTDEDIAKHRRWHAQLTEDFEAVRRVASAASTDVKSVTATVRDFVRPTTGPAPIAVSIRVTDDDELEPDENDLDTLTSAYEGEPVEDVTDALSSVPVGFVTGDDLGSNDDYPPALPTSDDDLDARIAHHTGAVPNL